MMGARHEVQWERMFPDELDAALAACPVVYFPYGLCEPHGPHNALGLDALKAHSVCCAAARAHGGVVAPPDYWHVHEIGIYAEVGEEWIGDAQPWLTAVPPWIHFKNICYHVRAADAVGFHAAIYLTGHYGPNWIDLKTVLEVLQPHFRMRVFGLPDYEANEPGFDGKTRDHAGKVETSLLWALEPDCVDYSRLPDPESAGPHFAMGTDAAEADRRVGERMVQDEVRWLGHKASELLSEYASASAMRSGAMAFLELERIWHDEIEPLLEGFASMAPGERPVAEESRWSLNYRSSFEEVRGLRIRPDGAGSADQPTSVA